MILFIPADDIHEPDDHHEAVTMEKEEEEEEEGGPGANANNRIILAQSQFCPFPPDEEPLWSDDKSNPVQQEPNLI